MQHTICVQEFCVSPTAPAVAWLSHTNTQRNESCWELVLLSIRLTTYLQTVGKICLFLWIISPVRRTCTFDSGACLSQKYSYESTREGGKEGRKERCRWRSERRWQGVDRMKNTDLQSVYDHIKKCIWTMHPNSNLNESNSGFVAWTKAQCRIRIEVLKCRLKNICVCPENVRLHNLSKTIANYWTNFKQWCQGIKQDFALCEMYTGPSN